MKWLLLCTLLLGSLSAQAECKASSGEKRVSLLELYTSQGCSSCPPADRWMGQLAKNGISFDQVIPLAFHVDYWDYIGWKDPFAKAAFSERQRLAARLQGSNTVYTPQFMLNGTDFRSWFRGNRLKEQIARLHQEVALMHIHLSLTENEQHQLMLNTKVEPLTKYQRHTQHLFIAIYENGLKTSVNAGENRGRELYHDYVVREWHGPFRLDQLNQTGEKILLIADQWRGKDAGAAAFVQNANTGEILQAVSLKICS